MHRDDLAVRLHIHILLPQGRKEADNDSATDAWNSLSSIADLVTTDATNRAEFLAECRSGRFDGVVAIYRTLSSVQITGRIDAELLDALPSSVRYIANCGIFSSLSTHIVVAG